MVFRPVDVVIAPASSLESAAQSGRAIATTLAERPGVSTRSRDLHPAPDAGPKHPRPASFVTPTTRHVLSSVGTIGARRPYTRRCCGDRQVVVTIDEVDQTRLFAQSSRVRSATGPGAKSRGLRNAARTVGAPRDRMRTIPNTGRTWVSSQILLPFVPAPRHRRR